MLSKNAQKKKQSRLRPCLTKDVITQYIFAENNSLADAEYGRSPYKAASKLMLLEDTSTNNQKYVHQ